MLQFACLENTLSHLAKSLHTLLQQVPLNIRVRETSDAGAPIVSSEAGSEAAAVYRSIAERVLQKLSLGEAPKAPLFTVS